jgi:hypothetical protein
VVTTNPVAEWLALNFLAFLRGGRRLRSVFVEPRRTDLELLGGWIAVGRIPEPPDEAIIKPGDLIILGDHQAFLMELDPPYCDVIVERFEKFTGKKAERVPADASVG